LSGKAPQTTTSSSWALNTVVSLGTVTAGGTVEDHGGGSAHIEHNAENSPVSTLVPRHCYCAIVVP